MDASNESRSTNRDSKSYCTCAWVKEKELMCSCGETDCDPDWKWDEDARTPAAIVSHNSQRVYFHRGYSMGNACIRGDTPMVSGNDYYWEIKILSFVYGTSVMVGIGTENFNINQSNEQYCNLLGSDSESWGMKFDGKLYHNNRRHEYNPAAGFAIGSIVGMHLDMWNGTLQFYLNRTPLGVAFHGLKNKVLYPMLSSTAAHSIMKLIFAHSEPHSLSLLSAKLLNASSISNFPPGLKQYTKRFWWLFPKPTRPKSEMAKKLEYFSATHGIYAFIDTDGDDDSDESSCNFLINRMKKILENSKQKNMALRLEPNTESTHHPSGSCSRPIRFNRQRTRPWMDY